MDSVTRFFASGFFMNQCPPSPRVSHLDCFEFFWKFAEIFVSQGSPLVPTTPMPNFATSFVCVVNTSGNFSTSGKVPRCQRHRWQFATDTSSKFATVVNSGGQTEDHPPSTYTSTHVNKQLAECRAECCTRPLRQRRLRSKTAMAAQSYHI